MTLDTNFNFFNLIKKASSLCGLDIPTTFADTDDDEYITLKDALNSVNRSIILMENERWTFRDVETTVTLETGVNSYTRPNGMIKKIKYGDEYVLDPEYAWEYLSDSTGQPNKYNIYGNNLLLYPTPTAQFDGDILTIRYCTNNCAQTPEGVTKPNMELETDFSLIPTQFSDVLLFGAARDYKKMPDKAKYQHFNSRYTQELRNMRRQMKRSLEIEPYLEVGGGRSNQDTSQWVDYFFNQSWL